MLKKLSHLSIALIFIFSLISKASADNGSFADVVETLLPSVVNISTTSKVVNNNQNTQNIPQFPPGSLFEEFFKHFHPDLVPQDREKTFVSLGSGFVISPDGYIVTNAHVIQNSTKIEITFYDNKSFEAEIVGIDKKTDLALLKIANITGLAPVNFGDSDKERVGDWAIAIGNPYGLGSSVSVGIISARSRDIDDSAYTDYLQTDAAINRGNSGGPLFNKNGELIGINTAIFSNSGGNIGIGFAIPSNIAKPIIDQLKSEGKVVRGWLGVSVQNISDEIAKIVGLEKAYGAYVVDVTRNSPASKSGIRKDDIILKYNEQAIENVRELPRLVGNSKIGEKVEIHLLRYKKGKYIEKKIKVKIGQNKEQENFTNQESEEEIEETKTENIAGMVLADLSEDVRSAYSISDNIKDGVIVLDFNKDSKAEISGIEIGDVLVVADQQKIRDLDHLLQIIKQAKEQQRNSILIRIIKAQGSYVMALEIGN